MNKLIISALLIFGLVWMTGTASADIIKLYELDGTNEVSVLEIPTGGSVEKLLTISAFSFDSPQVHTLSNTIYDSAWVECSDVEISYQEVYPSILEWDIEDYVWTQEADKGGSETLNIKFSVPSSVTPGTEYTIYIYDQITGLPEPITLIVTATSQIPEFPTIALPIAAVLGLMFIISSRKKEE